MLFANLSKINTLFLCFLMSILVWIGGCHHESDQNEDEAQTRYGLRLWGETLTTLFEAGEDVRQFKSCEDVLSKYKDSTLVSRYQLIRMKCDYWGKPFKWNIARQSDKHFIIHVISAGKNGVFENGKGDDLYVEIEYELSWTSPKIKFSPTRSH